MTTVPQSLGAVMTRESPKRLAMNDNVFASLIERFLELSKM